MSDETYEPNFRHLPLARLYTCPGDNCYRWYADPGDAAKHATTAHNIENTSNLYRLILDNGARARVHHLENAYPAMNGWTLDTYPGDAGGTAARDVARRWFDDGAAANLYLYGPVGSGKTGLAWALLRAHIEGAQETDSTFVNLRQHFAEVRRCLTAGIKVDPLNGLLDCCMLVVDDLGAERGTEFELEQIATLVEHRHVQRLCTIVTSNYDPDALVRRWSHVDEIAAQRIVSRLVADCVQLHVDGADRRTAARAA